MMPLRFNDWVRRVIPILMYHRIADEGPSELAPYRVAPHRFEQQLACLRESGYRSITLEQWRQVLTGQGEVADDRLVLLTFDDAYRDFLTHAWPLLCAYGFGATVFVPTDHVGGRADWDRAFGEPAELMDWDELRLLASQGLEIGAHSCTHPRLTDLPSGRILAEGRLSKQRLEAELGRPVSAMAYPHGEHNREVRRAMAMCGYRAAVTMHPGLSRLGDDPMAVRRQLVAGEDDLDALVAKLCLPKDHMAELRLRYRYARYVLKELS